MPSNPSFGDLGVPSALVAALDTLGITEPFPIQTATLPSTLEGRHVLGRGRTGSGKTLAFAVPMVARLAGAGSRHARSGKPRALVLVPTRELAAQVAATCTPLGKTLGLRVATVYGGVSQHPQVTALRRGVDILVACPGRLEDLIAQGRCDLSDVSITVLDEADHMADLGFLPAVKRLLDQTPADSQRLLFSATLDKEVDVLVRRYLRDPLTFAVDPVASAVPDAEHHVFTVQAVDKPTVVRELAGGQGRSLLFTRTKHGATRLAKQLNTSGIPSVELHGNLSQNARDRNLAAFSGGSARVLVATDIAARGIHVDDIALVVHVDPPAEHKAYLHRSGRTARAGAAGIVVTIATPNQAAEVRKLTKLAGIRAQGVTVKPGDDRITELRGPTAPLVHRAARPAVERPAFERDRRQPSRGGQSTRSGRPSRGGQSTRSGQPAKRSGSAAASGHQPAGASSGWKPRRARPAGPRHSGASRSSAGR